MMTVHIIKLRLLPIVFFLVFSFRLSAQSPLLDSVHRILFLGNSITYAGTYITDIETYFVTHYPNRKFEFINEGLPSETVSGLSEPGHAGGQFPRPDLHERLDRVLSLTQPDLVFVCYGMNDGIYLPFDKQRFQKFKEGLQYVHDALEKTGAKIVHLTPPFYDEQKGKQKGYEAALSKYADWVLSQKNTANWKVVDIYYPMKKFTQAHRKIDAAFAIHSFALAQDGVHPGEAGHWIMAKQVLLFLGEKSVAKAGDIKEAIASVPNSEEILRLVAQRQTIMKDAWLAATGHKRPGMNKGLLLSEAAEKYKEIDKEIDAFLKQAEAD